MSSFYALTQFPLTYHVLYETDAVCKMRLLRASAGVLWYDKELNLDLNDYFSLNDLGSSDICILHHFWCNDAIWSSYLCRRKIRISYELNDGVST